MPLYLDIHNIPGADFDDLKKAHLADLEKQKEYGVDYRKYWFNHECGKAYCLVEAPNAAAAEACHREAHGLVAERIIELDPELAEGFLGGGEINDAGAALIPGTRDASTDNGVRSVMFTDIVGSTELAQRMGDHVAFELVTQHDKIVRASVTDGNGRVIKHTGDGIMAVFVSPVQAVKTACRIQAEVAGLAREEGQLRFQVRIGVAAGEPIERDNDFFGSTVNLAARLCAAANPGAVLVTSGIAELCLGKGMQFAHLQSAELKGFDEAVSTREVMLTC